MLDTLLAQLIAKREGWGIPGDLPTRQNNPGDLRHAPGEQHPPDTPNSVGSFKSPAIGWAMLERQLNLFAGRGATIKQMIEDWAPASDGNDTQGYITYLCTALGCTPDTLVSDALKIPGAST
jgi:hypothetical protein